MFNLVDKLLEGEYVAKCWQNLLQQGAQGKVRQTMSEKISNPIGFTLDLNNP